MLDSETEIPVEQNAALAVIELKCEFARRLRWEAARIARSSGSFGVRAEHVREALPAAMQAVLRFVAKPKAEEQDDGVNAKAA